MIRVAFLLLALIDNRDTSHENEWLSSQNSSAQQKEHIVRVIKARHIEFLPKKGLGPQGYRDVHEHVGPPIDNIYAVLTGFEVGFKPREDRYFGMVHVSLKVERQQNGHEVHVIVMAGARDWSGDWDDEYYGWVDYLLIG